MAVVKREQIRLFDSWWVKMTCFNAVKNQFYIVMPDEYQIAFKTTESREPLRVTAATLKDVEAKFKEALEKLKTSVTSTRKVIAYKFYINSNHKKRLKDYWGGGTSLQHERQDIKETDDGQQLVGVGFDFEVVTERKVNDKVDYVGSRSNGGTNIARDHNNDDEPIKGRATIVAWTEEREDFLLKLRARLQALAEQAMAFEKAVQDEAGLDRTMLQAQAALVQFLPAPTEGKK